MTLAQWAIQIKRISHKTKKEVERSIYRLIESEFRHKVDPYGWKWRPPKAGGETMVKSGKLRNGFVVKVTERGRVEITNSQPYARYLQDGTDRMVARKMVPDRRLSTIWRDAILLAIRRAFS